MLLFRNHSYAGRYCFDVTKTMFSSGNITEKLRVSKFDCCGETVVDLYAGIGYYTLQYLVHTNGQWLETRQPFLERFL